MWRSRILLSLVFLFIVYCFLNVWAGYQHAKFFDVNNQLDLFTASLEVTHSDMFVAQGFKLYLKKNTTILDELEMLHQIEVKN